MAISSRLWLGGEAFVGQATLEHACDRWVVVDYQVASYSVAS